TLPIEHTNEIIATRGPTRGPQTLAHTGWSTRKKDCQNEPGTQAASAPAISRPPNTSTHTEAQSMTKEWLIAVNPAGDVSRDRSEPSVTDMSMAACPSIRPSTPRSA